MITQLMPHPEAVPLPIPEQARTLAQQFARVQPNASKSEQVQLNTLAVFATHGYCQMMGIATDLERSDSWNPIIQIMANVADLILPGLGRLECRPSQVGANICEVPPEVWDLRIGYVVIAIDTDLKMAHLLGFTPTVHKATLAISELQPPEMLLRHIHELKLAQEVSVPLETRQPQVKTVLLSQWLHQSFEAGWHAVETWLSFEQVNLVFSFRNVDEPDPDASSDDLPEERWSEAPLVVTRTKLLDVGGQPGDVQVVLLIEIQIESPDKTNISLQVHPASGRPYLPSDLELAVLEASDTIFMEARARQADNYIQLQLSGEPGERFQVRLQLEGIRYLEEFVM